MTLALGSLALWLFGSLAEIGRSANRPAPGHHSRRTRGKRLPPILPDLPRCLPISDEPDHHDDVPYGYGRPDEAEENKGPPRVAKFTSECHQ